MTATTESRLRKHMLEADALPEAIRAAVEGAATTDYHRGLLTGSQTWSGSDLRGKARKYSSSYWASRCRLIGAINDALPDLWDCGLAPVWYGDPIREHSSLVLCDPEGRKYFWS